MKIEKQVVLAPVPAIHLESAWSVPNLRERVAFGTSSPNIQLLTVGQDVFIFATGAQQKHFAASWHGTLSEIVAAVVSGPRSGKHPNEALRPPTAEKTDTAFQFFFHVDGLHPLEKPIPLSHFKSKWKDGYPAWPVITSLSIDGQ